MAYDKYAYQNKQIEMYRKALLDAQAKIEELENRIKVVARLNNVTIDVGGNVTIDGSGNVRIRGASPSKYLYDDAYHQIAHAHQLRMKYGLVSPDSV